MPKLKTRIKVVERQNGTFVYIPQVWRPKFVWWSVLSFPLRVFISALYILFGWMHEDYKTYQYPIWYRMPHWRNIYIESQEPEHLKWRNHTCYSCCRTKHNECTLAKNAQLIINDYIMLCVREQLKVVRQKMADERKRFDLKTKRITFIKHP